MASHGITGNRGRSINTDKVQNNDCNRDGIVRNVTIFVENEEDDEDTNRHSNQFE